MVTLYVPPGGNLLGTTGMIGSEAVKAENIKSRVTRNGITSSLTTLLTRLRQVKTIPPNGMAFFVGSDVDVVIEPPEPLTSSLYRCGSGFILDPLLEMLEEREVYGLIVMDRSEATLGILRGTRVTLLDNFSSNLPGKHNKGGQSQHRFERTMENESVAFYRKTAERALNLFGTKTLNGILVGGPGSTKDAFLEEGELDYRLKQKVVRPTFSTGYTDETGLKELVSAAAESLQGMKLGREQKAVREFLTLAKTGSLAAYGSQEVREALARGRVRTLLISKDHPDAADLSDQGDKTGATVLIVSADTDEGNALLRGFGGVGAILRY